MNWPPDRFNDNRWNRCLDALISAWNHAGPDATLEALTALELGPADGRDAAAKTEPPRCICVRFTDTGGFRIADLCCPVHGVGGTNPGDGYWEDGGGAA